MKRRVWIGAGVVGAVAVGAGVALRLRSEAAGVDRQAAAGLWQSSFERLGGGRLEMATLRGRPLVVNFWATWCAPCVREMPMLDRFRKEHAARGWEVVGIAADKEAPVAEFVARLGIGFPIALAGAEGIALSRRLGNHMGGLPFTVVTDREGAIRVRKIGEIKPEELADWASRFDIG